MLGLWLRAVFVALLCLIHVYATSEGCQFLADHSARVCPKGLRPVAGPFQGISVQPVQENVLQKENGCLGRGRGMRISNPDEDDYEDSCGEQLLAAMEIAARRNAETAFRNLGALMQKPIRRLNLRGGGRKRDEDEDDDDEYGDEEGDDDEGSGETNDDESGSGSGSQSESASGDEEGVDGDSGDEEDSEEDTAKSKKKRPSKDSKFVPPAKTIKKDGGKGRGKAAKEESEGSEEDSEYEGDEDEGSESKSEYSDEEEGSEADEQDDDEEDSEEEETPKKGKGGKGKPQDKGKSSGKSGGKTPSKGGKKK